MSGPSNIEWTDATWNPVSGCTKLSPGCKHCYAKTLHDKRHKAYLEGKKMPAQYAEPFEHVMLHQDRLDWPLRWRGSPIAKAAGRPSRIFVNSVSDLFHEDVPDEFIDRVFAVMGSCPWHTFQVLTKRADRMREWFAERWQPAPEKSQRDLYDAQISMARDLGISRPLPAFALDTEGEDRFDQVYAALDDVPRCVDTNDGRLWKDGQSNLIANAWPLRNVWLGVSVEDQAAANERIPLLLQTPAAVRWISAEPLIGTIDLYLGKGWCRHCKKLTDGSIEGHCMDPTSPCFSAEIFMQDAINWVVTGGESGPKARPSHPDWFRSLRDQCAAARVPYLFKQWGEWAPETVACSRRTAKTALYIAADGTTRPAAYGARNGSVTIQRMGKHSTGRLLDGVLHDEYPA